MKLPLSQWAHTHYGHAGLSLCCGGVNLHCAGLHLCCGDRAGLNLHRAGLHLYCEGVNLRTLCRSKVLTQIFPEVPIITKHWFDGRVVTKEIIAKQLRKLCTVHLEAVLVLNGLVMNFIKYT